MNLTIVKHILQQQFRSYEHCEYENTTPNIPQQQAW